MRLWRNILDSSPQGARYVIFLTDGLPTVGTTDENIILKDCKQANVADARVFAFGVGYDVNVRLLDKLVSENGGRSDYVKSNEPIETKVSSLYAKIKNPVMTGLKLSLRSDDVALKDMYPREMGDLFEGDQIVLVGRYEWKTELRGARVGEEGCPATLLITGTYDGKERTFEYPVSFRLPSRERRFAFVEQLWAVRRIGWLLDEIQLHGRDKEVIDEIVRLSLKYGIMTPYTSFLADETVPLHRKEIVVGRAIAAARPLADYSGAGAQMAAAARRELSLAKIAPAPSGMGEVVQIGQSDTQAYEAGTVQVVRNVRRAGDQAVYRRSGNVWVAANAAKVDLDKDARIKTVERFSEEYFKLVAENTVAENQVLATQQGDEELVIELRGQVYRIR
jgi:Ca-activated chloride channel family protein